MGEYTQIKFSSTYDTGIKNSLYESTTKSPFMVFTDVFGSHDMTAALPKPQENDS